MIASEFVAHLVLLDVVTRRHLFFFFFLYGSILEELRKGEVDHRNTMALISPLWEMSTHYMPGIILSFSHLMNYLPFKTNLQTTISPILQVKKLRQGEVKWLAQGHTARKWKSRDSNPESLARSHYSTSEKRIISHSSSVYSLQGCITTSVGPQCFCSCRLLSLPKNIKYRILRQCWHENKYKPTWTIFNFFLSLKEIKTFLWASKCTVSLDSGLWPWAFSLSLWFISG